MSDFWQQAAAHLLVWLWPCTSVVPSTRCWPWLVPTGGTAGACATAESFFHFHFTLVCNSAFCLCGVVFTILLQQFPGRRIQIENPPALPLVEMHCALCNRWLLNSLQNSSHSREKPALRCRNVDYPQSRGNKMLLVCAVRHDTTPQKAILDTQRTKACKPPPCGEMMLSRLEKYEKIPQSSA